jgi:serine/threonine protein kinase
MPRVKDRDTRLRYIAQLLSGIEAAHLRGICHRDIKPENVLYDGPSDRLLLADFGAANFGEDDLYTAVDTKDDERLANFVYAAPEQRVRGQQVDKRADLFALGLIVHEWFAGVVPQGTGYALIRDADAGAAWLDGVVEAMIRHSPSERPADVAAVRALLNLNQAQFIDGQKLDALTKQVVPATAPADPLLETPLKIVDVDWGGQTLTLTLNHQANDRLRDVFARSFSNHSVRGFGPEAFRFQGSKAVVSRINEYDAARTVECFQSWIPTVMQLYQQSVQRELNEAAEQRRQTVDRQKAEMEARARFRQRVKF